VRKCGIHECVGIDGDAGGCTGCRRTCTKCGFQYEGFVFGFGFQLFVETAIATLIHGLRTFFCCSTGASASTIRERVQIQEIGAARTELHLLGVVVKIQQ
jgi:hypothetical protein